MCRTPAALALAAAAGLVDPAARPRVPDPAFEIAAHTPERFVVLHTANLTYRQQLVLSRDIKAD